MIVVTYVGSFAISTFGGSPTEVAAPPIFENKHTAIKIRIGLTAESIINFMLAQCQIIISKNFIHFLPINEISIIYLQMLSQS